VATPLNQKKITIAGAPTKITLHLDAEL